MLGKQRLIINDNNINFLKKLQDWNSCCLVSGESPGETGEAGMGKPLVHKQLSHLTHYLSLVLDKIHLFKGNWNSTETHTNILTQESHP